MNITPAITHRHFFTRCLVGIGSLALCCLPLHAADSGGSAPATITKEGDLVVLKLKPEAEARLRLKTVAVEKRRVPAVRLFSGEVVRPLGAEGAHVAPVLGGTLDEVLRFADLQAVADGRILQAQVQADATKIAVDRAQKIFKSEAGSMQNLDDAKAAFALAEAGLSTAKVQRDLLGEAVGHGGSKRIWVRVAIYSSEAALLDAKAAVSIRALASGKPQSAQPVAGPPTANALANTTDWYYAPPADTALRAGERVAVEIPAIGKNDEHLVVPFSAVLHDIHGGQWVYERTAEHSYTRRRIQVARLAGSDAVLTSGPSAGAVIVTDGSAELFGTEFMTGK